MPRPSDMRYNWVRVRLAAVDEVELRALIIDAWTMVVPKTTAATYLGTLSASISAVRSRRSG
jgi:hypothetical protein